MSACEPCGFYHVLMGFELSRYAWFLAWSSIHFQTSILVFMSCFFFEDLIEIHFQYIPPPSTLVPDLARMDFVSTLALRALFSPSSPVPIPAPGAHYFI